MGVRWLIVWGPYPLITWLGQYGAAQLQTASGVIALTGAAFLAALWPLALVRRWHERLSGTVTVSDDQRARYASTSVGSVGKT
jgi:hypothetical protein